MATPGFSLADRAAALSPQRPLASNSEPYLRCMAEIEAAFGPTEQRRKVWNSARIWAEKLRATGSEEAVRGALATHRHTQKLCAEERDSLRYIDHWHRQAWASSQSSSRFWLLVALFKLRMRREAERQGAVVELARVRVAA